jgi:DNA-3-methyladenine glycosylase II
MQKAIQHLTKADPVMGRLIRRLGPYRIEYSPADFATLVRCIVYQQLSGKVAATIYDRLHAAAAGDSLLRPEDLLRLRPARMRALGLSRQKIAYIREAARHCRDGALRLEQLANRTDAEVMRDLTSIKGIGPWTAHMYLIFSLRRPDVLPTGDLGIRVAVRHEDGLDQTPGPDEVERIGQPWRPYATVASWYLWRSLGDGVGL